jgi:hypothetical protein
MCFIRGEGRGGALKNLLLFASVAAVFGGMTATGQEKSAGPPLAAVRFPAQQSSYSTSDIKILGTLTSGETSKPAEYSSTPKYRAFVFEGNGHDQVEVTVTGGNRKAYIALADSTLTPIASGLGRLSVKLPNHGPDTEAFYILVKNLASQPARLEVHLQKTPGSPKPSDATR